MLKLIVIISCLLLLLPLSYALEYHDYCSDNQTLYKFMNFTSCENVTCMNYNFTQYLTCQYGCDNSTSSCNASTPYQYLYVGIALLVIGVIAIIIIKVGR
jgi:hypothetical protein